MVCLQYLQDILTETIHDSLISGTFQKNITYKKRSWRLGRYLTYRHDVVESSDHISEHLFLFSRQLRHQFHHFSRSDVRHLEGLAELVVLV